MSNPSLGWGLSYPSLQLGLSYDCFVFKHLKNGAIDDMSVDGSSSPVDFSYQVPEGKTFYLRRVHIHMIDRSITPTKYGGITALTNGTTLEVQNSDGTRLTDFTDGENMTANYHHNGLAGVDSVIDATAATDDAFYVRWTIGKAGAFLKMTDQQKFVSTVQDNLTELTSMETYVQGILV